MTSETLAQQHHHYHPLRIARVVEETADARSFVVEVPEELKQAFAYEAGQYLTFQLDVDGVELLRCYSLSSSPECDSEHKVTVKRIADGRVSNWMNTNLKEGDTVRVLPPAGRFVLGPDGRDLVLFSGGSGITPVISIIKTALVTTTRRMKLVYANRDASSIIFARELDELAARHPERLRIVHSLDDRDGYLTVERAVAELDTPGDLDFYICGPGAFMDVVEEALDQLGVERSRVFIERFVSPDDPDHDAHPEETAARAAAADAGAAACETLHITLEGETHELAYTEGKTVLETVKEAGIEPPFSCEDGYCSCCMAKLVEGEVKMRKNDCLSDRDLQESWVLTCQSVPQTKTVKIDWDAS